MNQLEKLFEPITLGQLELRNRLVRPGVASNYATDGRVTERMKGFYSEIARGGVAMIVTGGMACLEPMGRTTRGLGIYEDDFIASLRELVEVVHQGGAKLAAQLTAPAVWTGSARSSGELIGPSDVIINPRGGPKPRPVTVQEIKQIVDTLGNAVRRARDAGFDAVEFHAGIGGLINQFISPYTNKRTDEYGGSLENRLRFFLEIIDMAGKKAGIDYTLIARVSGADFMAGGHTLEDTMLVAPVLEKAGIKAIDVTTGWHEAPVPSFHASVPQGSWAYLAEGVKKVVSIPVITGTRIANPVLANQILVEGKADMVYMARPLIADPELPNKAKEGRLDEIRPCIACSRCFGTIGRGDPMVCTVNARAGREVEYSIDPVKRPKKVFIIGGGAAGMEAARVAVTRGHRVTLAEEKDALGGQMLVAALPPYKEEIGYFTDYLVRQIDRLGVEIRLGDKVTVATVEEMEPDVVIVATGATPIIPDIPGAMGNNVATAIDVLTGKKEVRDNVVVIGGGMIGCETAEFLARKGKRVTILEILDRIGNDFERTNRWVVMQRLRQAQIGMETGVEVKEITETGARVDREGKPQFIKADSIVLAVGMKADSGLAEELQSKAAMLYVIGDCAQPQRIAEAVENGLRIGHAI